MIKYSLCVKHITSSLYEIILMYGHILFVDYIHYRIINFVFH